MQIDKNGLVTEMGSLLAQLIDNDDDDDDDDDDVWMTAH